MAGLRTYTRHHKNTPPAIDWNDKGRYEERVQRVSTQINRKPAANIHHATKMAIILGIPLNRHSTISFTQAGIDAQQASRVLQKLIAQRFSPWLRRHRKNKTGVQPTYVWVIEAANDILAAHLAVHIPAGLRKEFQSKLIHWVRQQSPANDIGAAVKTTRIYNITGLKRYLLKGADEHWAKICKIIPIAQGDVIGKRAGHSRNLGPVARRALGYRPRRNINFRALA